LLITDVPPSQAFSGALFTSQLCNFLGSDSLAAFVVVNPELKDTPVSPDCLWIPIESCFKPNESGIMTGLRKFGLPGIALSGLAVFLKELFIASFRIPSVVRRICRFGRKENIDRVWCILQGQTMIRLARRTARKLGVPLYTQVWDPPQWWLGANSIDRFTSARILKLYRRTLNSSRKVAAASFNMANIYGERYAANTVPVIPSLPGSAVLRPTLDGTRDRIIIALAGQIYALDAWNSLLAALDSTGWTVNGRPVTIRIMSYYLPNIPGHTPRHIEFLGYREQAESIRLLSDSDILYLPYWFDRQYDEVVRLSFPSKLTAYFAAGKPVLCHAPEHSSPAAFIRDNNAGIVCPSMDSRDIIAAIGKLTGDIISVGEYTSNGRQALASYLSEECLKARFSEFIDME